MKKFILILLLLTIKVNQIQAQNWQWAQNIYSVDYDRVFVNCVDLSGNIYLSGYFKGNSCYLGADTLAGPSGNFIAKYSQNGTGIYAKILSYVTSNYCGGGFNEIVYDSISNTLLLTGSFCGSIDFNGTTIYSSINNDNEAFVAKLDLSGNLIWIKKAEGNGDDFISGVSYDAFDNVYICGTNTFPVQIDTVNLPLGTFIAKLNSNGDLQWAKNISGVGNGANSIAFKVSDIKVSDNNFFLFGSAASSYFSIDTINFNFPMNSGNIISKFDLSGQVIWAKYAGYPKSGSIGYSLVLDGNKNVYAASSFFNSDTAYFDSTFITKIGSADSYLMKYDSSGNFKWVRQTSCDYIAEGWNVAIDSDQRIYVTGKFKGTAHFGNFTVSSDNSILSLGQYAYDAFLAAYDTSGVCLGVDHFPYAEGSSILVDNTNSPVLAGKYYGSISLGSNTYTAAGPPDAFIAKHDAITGFKGFEKSTSTNQLLIQANPNSGKCTINLPEEFVNEKNLSLSIYNNKGQLIQRLPLQFNESKIKLNLEAEAKGMYNAVLSNGTKNYSGKIIFE